MYFKANMIPRSLRVWNEKASAMHLGLSYPVHVRRVYKPPDAADGAPVLVDRLWARGLSRERAQIDLWAK